MNQGLILFVLSVLISYTKAENICEPCQSLQNHDVKSSGNSTYLYLGKKVEVCPENSTIFSKAAVLKYLEDLALSCENVTAIPNQLADRISTNGTLNISGNSTTNLFENNSKNFVETVKPDDFKFTSCINLKFADIVANKSISIRTFYNTNLTNCNMNLSDSELPTVSFDTETLKWNGTMIDLQANPICNCSMKWQIQKNNVSLLNEDHVLAKNPICLENPSSPICSSSVIEPSTVNSILDKIPADRLEVVNKNISEILVSSFSTVAPETNKLLTNSETIKLSKISENIIVGTTEVPINNVSVASPKITTNSSSDVTIVTKGNNITSNDSTQNRSTVVVEVTTNPSTNITKNVSGNLAVVSTETPPNVSTEVPKTEPTTKPSSWFYTIAMIVIASALVILLFVILVCWRRIVLKRRRQNRRH